MMFDEHFPPSCASTVMRWTPTWSTQTDPSGRYVNTRSFQGDVGTTRANAVYRAISIHNAKYDNA